MECPVKGCTCETKRLPDIRCHLRSSHPGKSSLKPTQIINRWKVNPSYSSPSTASSSATVLPTVVTSCSGPISAPGLPTALTSLSAPSSAPALPTVSSSSSAPPSVLSPPLLTVPAPPSATTPPAASNLTSSSSQANTNALCGHYHQPVFQTSCFPAKSN